MVIVFLYLVISPFFEKPLETLYGVVFLLAGIPFYLVFVRYKVAPSSFLRFVGELTVRRFIIVLKVSPVTSTRTPQHLARGDAARIDRQTDRHLYLVIKLRVVPSGAKSNLLSTGALSRLRNKKNEGLLVTYIQTVNRN